MDWKTPQDFGACGDGYTDDKQAFQNAVNSGYPIYIPWTPNGYLLSSRISLPSGTIIKGSDKKPSLKLNTAGEWLFDVVGSNIDILNIRSDFSHLSSGGVILLRTDLNSLERISIDNLTLSGMTGVVHDLPSTTNRIVYLRMSRIKAYGVRGIGINLQRSFAYQYAKEISILYNGIANTNVGWQQVGNEGGFFSEIDVTCGIVTPATSTAHGFHFTNCQAIWMRDCMADMVGGGGFYFDGGNNHIYLRDCVSSMVGTHGFSIVNNGSDVTLSGCKAGGRVGMPYAPNMPGIYAYNTPSIILDDACRTYNTVGGSGAGVQIVSCSGARDNAKRD